jgi:hypothetical protein
MVRMPQNALELARLETGVPIINNEARHMDSKFVDRGVKQ